MRLATPAQRQAEVATSNPLMEQRLTGDYPPVSLCVRQESAIGIPPQAQRTRGRWGTRFGRQNQHLQGSRLTQNPMML
jgi:hypothetical protein